jgi:hypothetical protein|tara:strand:- start:619 stop:828 length:210 start_codon:yes stop_codon:yes gene_type:complete
MPMNLSILQSTDQELVNATWNKTTRREAKKEIMRRKRIGSWALVANWRAEEEPIAQERVYAAGVRNGKR